MISSGQTISMSRGRTAIEHDLREYTPGNVDEAMTPYNRVLVNRLERRTLAEYTNDYMKEYIDEYNSKQRRADRKKGYDYAKTYVDEENNKQTARQNYKAGQLAYEYVIQFGDRNTMSVKEVVSKEYFYNELMEMFTEFVNRFEHEYPHMHILLATVHMDEPNGTPHMHILVQPIGEGYKQGLSHQVSLTKALSCDGFERADKKGELLSITRWQDDVKNRIMGRLLYDHGFNRVLKDGEKEHLPVDVYKRVKTIEGEILTAARAEADEILTSAEKSKERTLKYAETRADTIKREARVEADDMTRKAEKAVEKAEKKKNNLIKGAPASGTEFVPYEDWSMKDLETAKKKYAQMLQGGTDKQGNKIPSYNDLEKRYRMLERQPEKILETEVGKAIIEKEKGNIANRVINKFVGKTINSIKEVIKEKLKETLFNEMVDCVRKIMKSWNKELYNDDIDNIEVGVTSAVSTAFDDMRLDLNAISIHPRREDVESSVEEYVSRKGR